MLFSLLVASYDFRVGHFYVIGYTIYIFVKIYLLFKNLMKPKNLNTNKIKIKIKIYFFLILFLKQ